MCGKRLSNDSFFSMYIIFIFENLKVPNRNITNYIYKVPNKGNSDHVKLLRTKTQTNPIHRSTNYEPKLQSFCLFI